jgi:hypothetical protein
MDAEKHRKWCAKLRKLHALLGSDNAGEAENARRMIGEELARHKKSWNDLLELLAAENTQHDDLDDEQADSADIGRPAPLDLIRHILQRHLHLTEHQFVALTLWIAHTFVYNRFSITPRLALVSPVRGCGKTTVLNITNALGFKTCKFDHITPAALCRLLHRERSTVLLDEGDNADLPTTSRLRSTINSGHHCDGTDGIMIDGQPVKLSTFAPMALAAIGILPLPILHRSLVIRMERAPNVKLTRFDPKRIPDQQTDCDTVYREVFNWARQCTLNPDPPIPEGLRNRAADNWRVLLTIADACSPEWGRLAREAAVALSRGEDEDLAVLLLQAVREIFDRRPTTDRLSSAVIVAELNAEDDGLWSEWRGPRNDQVPRRFTQGDLARILGLFHIRSKSIWPPRRGTDDRSAKGYFRSQFEAAWASYCSDGTPAQHSNVKWLGR